MLEIIATLALATNCIQAPPHKPHHRRVPVAVASCEAPHVIMLQPEPDPLEPIAIYVRYPMIDMCYQDAPPVAYIGPPVASAPDMPDMPYAPAGGFGAYGALTGAWGGSAPQPSAPAVPHAAQPTVPRTVYIPPRHAPAGPPTAVAPEIDPGSAAGALTLLCGLLAVAKGRTTNSGGGEHLRRSALR